MKKIACKKMISNGKVIKNAIISINKNKIQNIEFDDEIKYFDFECVSPALIDLHINGGEEYHFTATPSKETLYDIEHSALQNGTGYTLPTIITSPFETLKQANDSLTHFYKENHNSGILGIHAEGPFLSKSKRGAHLSEYLQLPNKSNIDFIMSLKHVKLLTVAIEHFSQEQIEMFHDSDITLAIGHSNANYNQAQDGFANDIKLVTHLYNAMSGFGHRELGVVGAALHNEDVYCPIILDNLHLSKEAAQIAWKLKGEKLFLISDALFQNHKKLEFKWGEFDAHYRDTTYYNSEGNLAGASISMWDAVLNAKEWFDIPLEKALKLGTSIPASLIRHHRKIGKIDLGYEAKLISILGDKAKYIELD
jgi:N-acetylglucosamine-6-phosphate deacetylase